MWTRALLKNNAKNVLMRRGGIMLLTCILYQILTNLEVTTEVNFELSGHRPNELVHLNGAILSLGGLAKLPISGWSAGLLGALCAVAGLVIVPVLTVGYCRFLMESRQGNSPMSTLFSGFGNSYVNVLVVQLLTGLKIFLWGLLFVIPGIVKAYEYRMVPYLLAENPYLSASRAQELSRRMTDGEKLDMLVLDLSFVGWYIVAGLVEAAVGWCFGIVGLGWVNIGAVAIMAVYSYSQSTGAELYAALRAKLNAMNVLGEGELAGFVTYH